MNRLILALKDLDARIADPAGRDRKPITNALAGPGQSLLRTRLGRLDVLETLDDGRGYLDLLDTADIVDFEGREPKS